MNAAPAAGRLARLGFAEPAPAAARLGMLAEYGLDVAALLDGPLSGAGDPDIALDGLQAMVEALAPRDRTELASALAEPVLGRRLLGVLGASRGLGEHLRRHPKDWRLLVPGGHSGGDPGTTLLRAVGADPQVAVAVAVGERGAVVDALRIGYHRLLVELAARDIDGVLGVEEVAAELSDLAAAALEAALAIARAGLPGAADIRLAVIGMGKLGGRELNYVSDVDVLFVVPDDGAPEAAGRLAGQLIRICSEQTGEGTLWPVDAALRPEGRAGPLVRTLGSYRAYYERWAKTWEFQALMKARPVAGDRGLGAEFVAELAPLVWTAADHDGFVEDVQAMRRRVIEHIPAAERERELKLGPGGLRDVEFAVQLLQLVHGRSDGTIRSPTTLTALQALTASGYVGRTDGAALADAYRFLRRLEHRIQLSRLRRTHLMPTDEREQRALGRTLGLVTDPVKELTDQWRKHVREVRRLHERLFYRPLLAAVARIAGDEIRLTPDAARTRLAALGYAEPAAALRHLEALTTGVSRRAAIQRTLLPAMLGWLGDAPDPDAGLLAFRQVSDELGATPWYLRLLRDEGPVAQRLARLLGSSRFVADLIRREPEAIAMLADAPGAASGASGDQQDLRPRSRTALEQEMRAAAGRHGSGSRGEPAASGAFGAIRSIRRRELFRIATADVLDLIDGDVVVDALSDLAAATLTAGLEIVSGGAGGPGAGLALIGMGRLGGHEIGYGSDADVVFVGATGGQAEVAVVAELRRRLEAPAADPPLVLDTSLRPEGKSGPVVRSLDSYAAYYARWSHPWESQALLRADPIAGDEALRYGFVELADRFRYPEGGLGTDEIREIRRIKARVDAERLPRGADPSTHTKLGPGGLADVEWTVQLLQLRYAHAVPALRTTRTMAALAAAADAGLIERSDVEALGAAWRLATRARNAIMLASGRAADSLPHDARALAVVAGLCGYAPGTTGTYVQDYRRVTRRAHAVVDRIFWTD